MGKPNRTRRNRRKADQYKKSVKRVRRSKVVPVIAEQSTDEIVAARVATFVRLFERMERLCLSETDARVIATFATKDGVTYNESLDITDLADVDLAQITPFEFNEIVKRANRAINTLTQTRVHQSTGPFFVNRGMRRREIAKTRKRRTSRVKK